MRLEIEWRNRRRRPFERDFIDLSAVRNGFLPRPIEHLAQGSDEKLYVCKAVASWNEKALELDYAAPPVCEYNMSLGLDMGLTLVTFENDEVAEVAWKDGYGEHSELIWSVDPPTDGGFSSLLEGTLVVQRHLRRERSGPLRERKLAEHTGGCEVCCQRPFENSDWGPVLEVHHCLPLSHGPRSTTVGDLAVLCPTCHRAIHAAIRDEDELYSIEEFRRQHMLKAT